MTRRLCNAANLLTLSRFALAPVMLWLVTELRSPAEPAYRAWVAPAALALLVTVILTDLLDGMVARGYDIVTNFGKIMDPVADSTFFMTMLFGFVACPRFALPVWMPVVVLWREIGMHVLRRYAALRGTVLAAKVSGKAKMFLQSAAMVGFFALLAARDLGYAQTSEPALAALLFYIGAGIVIVNVVSLLEYAREIPHLISEYRQDGTPGSGS